MDNGFPLADLTALSYDKLMMHGQVATLELVFKSGRNGFLEMLSSLKDSFDNKLYNIYLKWIELNVESRQELEKLKSTVMINGKRFSVLFILVRLLKTKKFPR